jgi:SecD/SecF fusion protein
VVNLPGVSSQQQAGQLISLLGGSGQLEFYDWEANVLTPSGKPVASLLTTGDPTVLMLSQGVGSYEPGSPSAGAMTLYAAVKLAAHQAARPDPGNSRTGPEYFVFGKAGSADCRIAGGYYQIAEPAGACYLAGPLYSRQRLAAALPPGAAVAQSMVLTVKQGWTILRATPQSFGTGSTWSDPFPNFFVLRDHVAVPGADIQAPLASTDPSGTPDVVFGFTPQGAAKFQAVTEQVARRGSLDSPLGRVLAQHFAVALDTQLITLPYVDFKQYPNGIPGNHGALIVGGFTHATARKLAAELEIGRLAAPLELLSVRQIR